MQSNVNTHSAQEPVSHFLEREDFNAERWKSHEKYSLYS